MLNSLDLMVMIFMALATLSLLSLSLLFLVRNPRIKKVCFFMVAVLALYAASIGVRIGGFLFPVQTAVGVAAGIVSIAAIVLVLTGKGNEKKFNLARTMAAASLVIGIVSILI